MRKKVTLITGASGEVGTALVERLAAEGNHRILAMDVHPELDNIKGMSTFLQADILDKNLFSRLVAEYEIETIYHLAALLSTRAEFFLNKPPANRTHFNQTLLTNSLGSERYS